MTTPAVLLGLLRLVGVVGPLGIAAVVLRSWFVPDWKGPIARLTELTLGLALLCALGQLLGTMGLFHLGPLVGAAAGIGGSTWLVERRRGTAGRAGSPAEPNVEPTTPTTPVDRTAVVTAIALLAGMWSTWVAHAVEFGIGNGDSVWYHLPMAARFAQTGDVWTPFFANGEALVSYYPANASLLHGVGFLAFGSDALSLVLNVALLPVALLAGWCVGQPAGRQAHCVIATTIVLALPVMATSQPGTAKDDLLSIAMLLASAAFLTYGRDRPSGALDGRALALSGLGAGLAVAAKLTMVVPVAALGLGLLAFGPKGRRVATVIVWGVPLLLGGAYWYVRNLVVVGNPIPSLGLALPKPPVASIERFGSTVAGHLTEGSALTDVFGTGLALAIGPAWLPILVAALVGAAVALAHGTRTQRILGLAALLTIVGYAVTPGGAYGVGARGVDEDAVAFIFAYNLRYVAPALMLGLCAFAHAPGFLDERPRRAVLAGFLALLLATQLSGAGSDSWSRDHTLVAIAVMALVGGAGSFWVRQVRPGRRLIRGGIALAVVLVVAGGPAALSTYDDGRYQLSPFREWVDSEPTSRIGVVGFVAQFPLLGDDLANRVEYIGERGPNGSFAPYVDCTEFRDGLRERRLDYLVVPNGPVGGALGVDLARWRMGQPGGEPPLPPVESAWVQDEWDLDIVSILPEVTVYSVGPHLDHGGCPE